MCDERCEKHGQRCEVLKHHLRPGSTRLHHDHYDSSRLVRHSWTTPIPAQEAAQE